MENQINMEKGSLEPLTKETVAVISGWEYEASYEVYSFKGHHDEYVQRNNQRKDRQRLE